MGILTLLKANIRYRKGSFISVMILTLIISICLTTIISINHNIEKRSEDSLKLNNVGDLISIIWDVKCTDSMLQKIKDNQNIDHIALQKAITQTLIINEKQKGDSTFFIPYNQEKQSYKIYNMNGLSFQSKPKKLQSGEIYVPISFGRIYNCKIGDKAYLTDGDTTKSFTIKGFFEEPFVGAEIIGLKLALMNEEDFNARYAQRMMTQEERDKNVEGIRGYYLINLFTEKNSDLTMSEQKRSINEASRIVDYSLITISKDQSKTYTLMFTQIISGIMMAFLILLFLVVLIVIGHSISTGIEMDYTNLGILKAIGFDKGKLRKVFVLEYVLAELIGAIAGIVLSLPAIYYLNSIFVRMTGLLSTVKPAYGRCLTILAALLLLSALFVFIKTKAIIKVSPVCAISGGRDSVYFHSRLEIPVEGKMLFTRIVIRQLTSNVKQYISSTVIVAILTYFLITITLLNTAMDIQTIEESFGVAFSDVVVGYNPQKDKTQEDIIKFRKQVETEISGVCKIEKFFQIYSSYFTVNGDEYHGSIYGDPTLIKSMLKGRAPLYDNEIVITEIVAKELGVHMGDTVTVGNEKLEEQYIISGYFQSTNDMGRTIAMSFEGAKKIIQNLHMDYVDYVLTDSNKSAEIVQMLDKKYGEEIFADDVNEGDDFGDMIIGSMSILNVVIYAISILFAFVVILIVCGKIFLKERIDYGIYKAVGFTSFALRLQFALRFAFVALIGGILGMIINLGLNNTMMSALLTNIGISSFKANYNLISLLLPIVVITVCFFAFAFLVSGKIKRVDTRSLISNN